MSYKGTGLVLVLASCAWLGVASASAQRYAEISGEIRFVGYGGGPSTNTLVRLWQNWTNSLHARPRTNHFICVTGSNEWRIDDDFTQGSQQVCYFDGTNVYNSSAAVILDTEEKRQRLTKTGLAMTHEGVTKSGQTISIYPAPEGNPRGDFGANIPWLAFCSGTYLKHRGRLVPLPCCPFEHTRDRLAYTDRSNTFNDDLGLPREVDLFLSRELYIKSENDFDAEYNLGPRYTAWTMRTASALDEGTRMFQYKVNEATNILGWNIPTEFEFSQYGRPFEQNGDWFCRGKCVVKSIRPTGKPVGPFAAGCRQTVVDARFRDPSSGVNGIIYISTNAFVSPTNDPALQTLLRARIEQGRPAISSPD